MRPVCKSVRYVLLKISPSSSSIAKLELVAALDATDGSVLGNEFVAKLGRLKCAFSADSCNFFNWVDNMAFCFWYSNIRSLVLIIWPESLRMCSSYFSLCVDKYKKKNVYLILFKLWIMYAFLLPVPSVHPYRRACCWVRDLVCLSFSSLRRYIMFSGAWFMQARRKTNEMRWREGVAVQYLM